MSRRLSALFLSAVLATAASAGEVRYRCWPIHFVPVDLIHVKVVMDVGYWVDLVECPDVLRLKSINVCTYEGSVDVKVRCNFRMSMRCQVTPTGAIPGQYRCWMEGGDIEPPGGTARAFVRLENANVAAQLAGRTDVHVATLTIQITPWL
jgi:hypothetical protein